MRLKKGIYIDVSQMGEFAGIFAWFLKPIKSSLEDPETDWRLSEEDKHERDVICGNIDRIVSRLEDPNSAIPVDSINKGVSQLGEVLKFAWVENITTHSRPRFSRNYLESITQAIVVNGGVERWSAEELDQGHRLLERFVLLTKGAATRTGHEYDKEVEEIMTDLGKLLAGKPEAKARVILIFSSTLLHRVMRSLQSMSKGDEKRMFTDLYEIHPYYRALGNLLSFPIAA